MKVDRITVVVMRAVWQSDAGQRFPDVWQPIGGRRVLVQLVGGGRRIAVVDLAAFLMMKSNHQNVQNVILAAAAPVRIVGVARSTGGENTFVERRNRIDTVVQQAALFEAVHFVVFLVSLVHGFHHSECVQRRTERGSARLVRFIAAEFVWRCSIVRDCLAVNCVINS